MVRAVSVGDNCIDHYLPPVERTFVGGNAVNVAVAMRRLGIESAYAGAVGSDEEGRRVLDALRAEGIDVSQVRVMEGKTAVTDISLRDGDRVIVDERMGVMEAFHPDEALLASLSSYDLVHNTLLGQTADDLRGFKKRGLATSFDFSDRSDEALLHQTLPYVDIAFLSLPGTSRDDAEAFAMRVAAAGPRVVVVTMGPNGSLAYDGLRCFVQAALPVEPLVDTLGAGDALTGAFLATWLEGGSLPECLYQGALLAAQTCTHLGAWVPKDEREGELKR